MSKSNLVKEKPAFSLKSRNVALPVHPQITEFAVTSECPQPCSVVTSPGSYELAIAAAEKQLFHLKASRDKDISSSCEVSDAPSCEVSDAPFDVSDQSEDSGPPDSSASRTSEEFPILESVTRKKKRRPVKQVHVPSPQDVPGSEVNLALLPDVQDIQPFFAISGFSTTLIFCDPALVKHLDTRENVNYTSGAGSYSILRIKGVPKISSIHVALSGSYWIQRVSFPKGYTVKACQALLDFHKFELSFSSKCLPGDLVEHVTESLTLPRNRRVFPEVEISLVSQDTGSVIATFLPKTLVSDIDFDLEVLGIDSLPGDFDGIRFSTEQGHQRFVKKNLPFGAVHTGPTLFFVEFLASAPVAVGSSVMVKLGRAVRYISFSCGDDLVSSIQEAVSSSSYLTDGAKVRLMGKVVYQDNVWSSFNPDHVTRFGLVISK